MRSRDVIDLLLAAGLGSGAQKGQKPTGSIISDPTGAISHSRDYARAYSSHSAGANSGSGSARLDLSQKGDLPSSGALQLSAPSVAQGKIPPFAHAPPQKRTSGLPEFCAGPTARHLTQVMSLTRKQVNRTI